MANGKWIGLDEYYHKLGYEVYGDEWDQDYIKQIIPGSKKDRQSEAFKRSDQIHSLFYDRIWNDTSDIHVMYRKEQGFVPPSFTIESFFIHRSECLDKEAYPRKCKIFLPAPENRGRRRKHDREYLLSIFDNVLKCVRGKISYRSMSEAYCEYFQTHKIDKDPPSKSWIEKNIYKEIKAEKENNNF